MHSMYVDGLCTSDSSREIRCQHHLFLQVHMTFCEKLAMSAGLLYTLRSIICYVSEADVITRFLAVIAGRDAAVETSPSPSNDLADAAAAMIAAVLVSDPPLASRDGASSANRPSETTQVQAGHGKNDDEHIGDVDGDADALWKEKSSAEDAGVPLTFGVALWALRSFVADHREKLEGDCNLSGPHRLGLWHLLAKNCCCSVRCQSFTSDL